MKFEKETKRVEVNADNTAQAFLELLALRGIDCFFGNAGTDFASIVDAFSRRKTEGKKTPNLVTVPHEIPLISMAHGYYLATGRVQAAMVHVGVGPQMPLAQLWALSGHDSPCSFLRAEPR